jgi:hypothetical protein
MIARSFKLMSLLFCTAVLRGEPAASEEERVWLLVGCDTQALVFELMLDGKRLYSQTMPVCQTTRAGRSQGQKVSFTFQPPRSITWTGYRDAASTTAAGQELSVDLWQAGADAADLVLGMSVSIGQVLYMNATHVAYMDRRSTTEIEQGLVIATHPTDTAGWVHVPGGLLIRPECVHQVPNGASIDGDSGNVSLNGVVIAHWDKCAEPGIFTRPKPPDVSPAKQ